VVAVPLVLSTTTAVVFGVAALRAGKETSRITTEATRFSVSAPGIMTAALISSGVLAAVAVAAAWLQDRHVSARLRIGPTRASAAGLIATVVGMVGLSMASGAATDLLGGRGRGTMGVIAHAFAQPTPLRLLIAIATIAIAPGAAEETFFRGLIQTKLTSRWGRWPSIYITALGFGLMHLDLIQGLVAFIAGLFLGWAVERFGGIRPSIAAHASNNAAFVVLASFGSATEGSRSSDLVVLAFGLIAWLLATATIRSHFALCPQPRSPLE
jgi:membrane protease YdiL (CAAX protease family)